MSHQQKPIKHPENMVGNDIRSQIITSVKQHFKVFFKEKHTNY